MNRRPTLAIYRLASDTYTQEKLSRKMSVSSKTISRWERAPEAMRLDDFCAYCAACGIPAAEAFEKVMHDHIERRSVL